MRIRACRILSGKLAPDPTYKNLYAFSCYDDDGKTPSEIVYAFFDGLRSDLTHPIDKYDVPFPEGAEIYTIGETERGFMVDLPTDDGFPSRPAYLIINTKPSTETPEYRFAFVLSYQRNGEQKIRCSCVFDQWAEHYSELAYSEMTFSRTHQKRYVDSYAATRRKLYNGLSDPVPEGMVIGRKTTVIPEEMNGVYTSGSYKYIPLWVYWRLSMRDWYGWSGSAYVQMSNPLYGVDPSRGAVPVIAMCVGSIQFQEDEPFTARAITPLRYIELKNGTVIDIGSADSVAERLNFSNPYISQAILTTIPPVPAKLTASNRLLLDYDDSATLDIQFKSDGNYVYRIGADMFPLVGTLIQHHIGDIIQVGVGRTYDLTDERDSSTYVDSYEPKIEEMPFEEKTLSIYGADIDISPSPAKPNCRLEIYAGSHTDAILFTTDRAPVDSKELHRIPGITWQFGLDMSTEAVEQWLLTNFNTYQNARMWKSFNNAIGGVGSMFGAAASGNVGGSLTAAGGTLLAAAENIDTHIARMKDLQNSPNSVNVTSQNGFDNIPLVDIPRIKKRVIPDDIKTKIMQYWHVYGYPDNRTGTIANTAITRQNFNYIQGTFLRMLPGVYEAEVADIMSAFRSGVWLWMPSFNIDHRPPAPDVVYYTTNYLTSNIATLENREIMEE